MRHTAELRNWHQVIGANGTQGIFWGRVYNDRRGRWPDGRRIHTSVVTVLIDHGLYYTAVTLNSTYRLPKKDCSDPDFCYETFPRYSAT